MIKMETITFLPITVILINVSIIRRYSYYLIDNVVMCM